MRVSAKLFAIHLHIVIMCGLFLQSAFAQATPTKKSGASIQSSPQNAGIEQGIPLDKFDVLAMIAGSFSQAYEVAQIEQRGVTFVLDSVFVAAARPLASSQVIAALRTAHVRMGPDRNTSRPKAYMALVRAVKEEGEKDYAAADAAFLEAIELEPNSAALHRARAFELVTAVKYSEAENEARMSLKLEQNDPEAHCILSVALLREMLDVEAIAEARESLRLFRSDNYAMIPLAMALIRSKQYKEAIPVLHEGIAQFPKFTPFHKDLGVALFYAGDSEGAIAELKLFLATEADEAEAHYVLGAALRSLQRNDEARDQFRLAAKLDPNNPIFAAVGNPDAALQSPPNGENPGDGSVSGSTYTNRFFGFSVEFPKGWNVLDEDTARSMFKMGAAVLMGDDPIQRDIVQAGAKLNRPLLFVMKGRSNAQSLEVTFFGIYCIRIQGMLDLRSGRDYLELMAKSPKDLNAPIQGSGEYEQISIGGKEFWKTRLMMQFAAGPQTMLMYATLSKGYVLIFHLQSSDPQGFQMLKSIPESAKFTEAVN